jgi:hypothetical protein
MEIRGTELQKAIDYFWTTVVRDVASVGKKQQNGATRNFLSALSNVLAACPHLCVDQDVMRKDVDDINTQMFASMCAEDQLRGTYPFDEVAFTVTVLLEGIGITLFVVTHDEETGDWYGLPIIAQLKEEGHSVTPHYPIISCVLKPVPERNGVRRGAFVVSALHEAVGNADLDGLSEDPHVARLVEGFSVAMSAVFHSELEGRDWFKSFITKDNNTGPRKEFFEGEIFA